MAKDNVKWLNGAIRYENSEIGVNDATARLTTLLNNLQGDGNVKEVELCIAEFKSQTLVYIVKVTFLKANFLTN